MYSFLEKLVLASVIVIKKLRHYFQTIMSLSWLTILSKVSCVEHNRQVAWENGLLHSVATTSNTYPWITIKTQAQANFCGGLQPKIRNDGKWEVACINRVNIDAWTLFVDGSSNFHGTGFGFGVIQKSAQWDKVGQAICCDFKASNNEVKYEALTVGMTLAYDLGQKCWKYTSINCW